ELARKRFEGEGISSVGVSINGDTIYAGTKSGDLLALDPETLEMRGRLAGAWQYDPNGMWLRAKIRERVPGLALGG
ncbi:MAG: PQQ-binding-like beta-propeller repeat protein, partial [Mycobacterium sp.]